MSHVCRACGAGRLVPFYAVSAIPVNSCLLLDSEALARTFPTGDLELACCESCGLIQNVLFQPELATYSADYEETQGYSPRFNRLVDEIVAEQERKHGLAGKTVIEIGCGKGEFLTRLVELTGARGIGIDPAYRRDRLTLPAGADLTFIQDFFGPAHGHIKADFVVCRHTLEHIADVAAFLTLLRQSIGERIGVVALFEVPDATRILKERAFWDIYYEHCNYFTAGSLARAFRRAGFVVIDAYTVYDDQYLILEARTEPGSPAARLPMATEERPTETAAMARSFSISIADKLRALREQLDGWVAAHKRVVLWGSGSKAAGYLVTLNVRDQVLAVVDINPHKAEKYQAGTGHRIVLPSALPALRPDVVLVMNPIYRSEIAQSLAEMGLHAELHALS